MDSIRGPCGMGHRDGGLVNDDVVVSARNRAAAPVAGRVPVAAGDVGPRNRRRQNPVLQRFETNPGKGLLWMDANDISTKAQPGTQLAEATGHGESPKENKMADEKSKPEYGDSQRGGAFIPHYRRDVKFAGLGKKVQRLGIFLFG